MLLHCPEKFTCLAPEMAQGFGHSLWSLTLDWSLGRISAMRGSHSAAAFAAKPLNSASQFSWSSDGECLAIIFRFTLIAQDVFRWCSLSRDAAGGAGWTCSPDSVGGGLRKSGSVSPSQIRDVLWQSSRRGLTYLSLIFCWSKAITA